MNRKQSLIYPIFGSIMVGHFFFCLCRGIYLGTPEQVLWISHVGTLIGGIGAYLRNRFLISVALVTCFGHHMFWLFDTLTWIITGRFALGATAYLKGAGLAAWVQSSNHFFVVPALLILAILQGRVEKYAWVWASVLSIFLVTISLVFLPAASNINCAHHPWHGFEQIVTHLAGLNPFSLVRYLCFITGVTIFGNYLLANLVLGYAVSKCAGFGQRTQNLEGEHLK